MGLDIGLKDAVAVCDHKEGVQLRKYAKIMWTCDIVSIYMLEDISPAYDANMMRIYADVYRKDVVGLNNEQLAQLATSYQQAIKCFVYQNVFDRITKIVHRWKSLAMSTDKDIFSIPTNALTLFDNLLTIHRIDPNVDDTLQFNAFQSSLLRNSVEWFKAWHEDFDTSKYIVPKERFLEFLDIVEQKLRGCFQKSNPGDAVAIDYHSKIKQAVEYVKTLLLICHQTKIESKKAVKSLINENFSLKYDVPQTVKQDASAFATNYSLLTMNHIVCLNTNSKVKVVVPKDGSGSIDTDEYLYLYTAYVQDHIVAKEL